MLTIFWNLRVLNTRISGPFQRFLSEVSFSSHSIYKAVIIMLVLLSTINSCLVSAGYFQMVKEGTLPLEFYLLLCLQHATCLLNYYAHW